MFTRLRSGSPPTNRRRFSVTRATRSSRASAPETCGVMTTSERPQNGLELGSGYSVALKDLELRGAGNLLGANQSGFAHAVGLDVYLRLLEKTVEKMREKEGVVDHPDPEVALGGSAYLPEGYISDPAPASFIVGESPDDSPSISRQIGNT